MREFGNFQTPVPRTHPTTTVVGIGPYRFTRKPIYVAFTLSQTRIAVWSNIVWLLVTLVPTVLLIRYGVIAREERYMARKFGEPYLRYKASVRRWL